MRFFKLYSLRIALLIWGFTIFVCCKHSSDTSIIPSSSSNLTTKIWLFDQASAVGGGYTLNFQRGKVDDPFGLANVRVKFNDDGTISGTDNTGNPIKNGVWQLLSNGQKLTISGTNVFGIDGTSVIDKLDGASLVVSNTLDVPQVGSVSIKGVLVHE